MRFYYKVINDKMIKTENGLFQEARKILKHSPLVEGGLFEYRKDTIDERLNDDECKVTRILCGRMRTAHYQYSDQYARQYIPGETFHWNYGSKIPHFFSLPGCFAFLSLDYPKSLDRNHYYRFYVVLDFLNDDETIARKILIKRNKALLTTSSNSKLFSRFYDPETPVYFLSKTRQFQGFRIKAKDLASSKILKEDILSILEKANRYFSTCQINSFKIKEKFLQALVKRIDKNTWFLPAKQLDVSEEKKDTLESLAHTIGGILNDEFHEYDLSSLGDGILRYQGVNIIGKNH